MEGGEGRWREGREGRGGGGRWREGRGGEGRWREGRGGEVEGGEERGGGGRGGGGERGRGGGGRGGEGRWREGRGGEGRGGEGRGGEGREGRYCLSFHTYVRTFDSFSETTKRTKEDNKKLNPKITITAMPKPVGSLEASVNCTETSRGSTGIGECVNTGLPGMWNSEVRDG